MSARLLVWVFCSLLATAAIVPALQAIGGERPVVYAQGSEDGEDEGMAAAAEKTLIQQMFSGGPLGWAIMSLIIVLSVVMMSLIIEHMVTIRRDRLVPPHLLNELEDMFEEEAYEDAMDLCDRESNFMCRVVGGGLAKLGSGYDRMMISASNASEEEATTLNQKISYLSLIASVAPMLGLLGTVIGMIQAFQKIAIRRGMAQPHELADGISLALFTTCFGLIVAIPALGAYTIFRNRVVKVVQEVDSITGELLDRFRPVE